MSLELNDYWQYNATMEFNSFLQTEAEELDKALLAFLSQKQVELAKINSSLEELFALVMEANKGGKRLRGLLVKLGYLMAGGGNSKAIVKPMMAVEIFHSAILSHDDIIDQSPLRRNQPTMHFALGNDHHAVSQTIILGDYGLFLANKLIIESDFDLSLKNNALSIFTNTVLDTIIGEIIDVEIPFKNVKPLEKDALTISLFKTARYTITAPLQIGCALASGNKELLAMLQEVGDNLGIAFQIQDDILGVFGESTETGKSNLSDLQEGKVTLLASFAFDHASGEQKEIIKKLYGKEDLTEKGASEIREIFKSVGALDFAHRTALEYTSSALTKIDSLPVDEKWKATLNALAGFLMKRKK